MKGQVKEQQQRKQRKSFINAVKKAQERLFENEIKKQGKNEKKNSTN